MDGNIFRKNYESEDEGFKVEIFSSIVSSAINLFVAKYYTCGGLGASILTNVDELII